MSQTKAQLLDTLVASLLPASDSSVDIGSNAVRFANIYGDTLYGNGANLTGINTDLVSDTSPQLGSDLQSNGHDIDFADNDKAIFGTGSDFEIYHNGFTSIIASASHFLAFYSDSGINFHNANGTETFAKFIPNGAAELYYDNSKKLETTNTGAVVTGNLSTTGSISSGGNISLVDTGAVILGTSNDCTLSHSGTNTIIDNNTGDLILRCDGDDVKILAEDGIVLRDNDDSTNFVNCINGGAVELYHNGSKKFETTSAGVSVTGEIQTTGHIRLPDNMSLIAGDGNDLFIFHNGSHSRILDSGAGKLQLGSDTEVEILNGSFNETMAKFIPDGAVELYHNNHKSFQTSTHGAQFFAPEGGTCQIYLYADEGDDNADLWGFQASHTASEFKLINYASGSYEDSIVADGNGAVELYYDNVLKLRTQSGGVTFEGTDSGGNVSLGRFYYKTESGTVKALYDPNGGKFQLYDSVHASFGNSHDLQIYHDGSNSYIKEDGTGSLLLWSTGTEIKLLGGSGAETLADFNVDGAVELYHDSNKKFETISAGIRVTGDYVGDNDWIKVSKLTSYDTTKSPIQQNSKTYWYTRLDDANSIQSSEFRNLAGSGGNSNSFQSTIIPVDNMTRQSDAGSFSAYNSSTNTQATRTNMAGADDFNIATKGLSMGCLVRLENTGSNGSGIIFYGDGDTEDHFFSRYKYNGHGLMIGEDTNGSDNWTAAYPTSFFNDGEWRFVVMAVATNGTLMVSINGDRLTPVRLTGSVPTPDNAHFGIQGDTYNDNAARHRFATFWWYEGVISDALVAQEYAWLKTIWTSASGLT